MENIKNPKLENKKILKMLVKSYDNWQSIRKKITNQLKLKSVKLINKGTDFKYETQNEAKISLDLSDAVIFKNQLLQALQNENNLEKEIEKYLELFPIYTEWLKGITGIGIRLASIIISNYDIEKANTVSKMWSFTGYNPSNVQGYKWKTNLKTQEKTKILTNDMIKGDKLTAGYCSPFNKHLRTQMYVLAESFIKQRTMPYRKIYDDYKERLNNRNELLPKKEKLTKGHINFMAIRKMNKYFLQDLYVAWRTLEGLEVRKPYKEEYLNKKHS